MKKLVSLLLTAFLYSCAFAPAFADTTTTHYSLTQPSIGNTTNWGISWNSNATTIDSTLWSASGGMQIGINTISSSTSVALSNPIDNVQLVTFSTTGKSLNLSPMNATSSPVAGGIIYVTNNGSNSFEIFAQDGSTVLLNSLGAGQTVSFQVTSNSTANGSFIVVGPYVTSISGNFTSELTVTSNNNPNSLFQTTGSNDLNVDLNAGSSGNTPSLWFLQAGTAKWQTGVTGSTDVYFLRDAVNSQNHITAYPNGSLVLGPDLNLTLNQSGNAVFGGTITVTPFSNAGVVQNNSSGLLSSSTALANGTTATTQSAGDTSTDVATDSFVSTGLSAAHVNIQTFTSNGTWTKPSIVSSGATTHIQCWGGGGGGGQGGVDGGAGGGGGYSDLWVSASSLSSTVSVTIGAGGGFYTNGGNSTFGSYLTAYGGGASASGGGTQQGGGGGGGIAAGNTYGQGYSDLGCQGMAYFVANNTTAKCGTAALAENGYYNGGGGGNNTGLSAGGNSVWGGGGGGGGTGGTSAHGGNGGNSSSNGSVPGGGGGYNGSGASGECVVTTWP